MSKIKDISLYPYGGVSDSNRSLTGSSTLLRITYFDSKRINILVDVGMFQGEDEIHNEESFKVNATEIDVVLITHNHVDHIGLLPRLYSEGFNGKVYTHKNAIADLKHIFEDNLNIMETNIKIATLQRKSLGKKLRIAFSNISNSTKREVLDEVDPKTLEDRVIAYGLLHKHGITSKRSLKKFERAKFREINRVKKYRASNKKKSQSDLQNLVSELSDALDLVNSQEKQSIISYPDSEKLLRKYNIKESSDISTVLPKVPELLYTKNDINGVISNIIGFDYNKFVNIIPGVSICAYNAVHLPWSSQIVVNIHKECNFSNTGYMRDPKRILFSGDIGKIRDFNLLGDLDFPKERLDCALVENTYGDRNHRATIEEDIITFEKVYKKTLAKNGKILFPTFSNHRIHQALYMINFMIEKGILPKEQKVYIISALGKKLHSNRLRENPYIHKRFLKNKNFEWLESDFSIAKIKTKDNVVPIVLASSGMVDGGSIMKLLEQFLPFKNNTLVSVGYMAIGTYGRQIVDGEKSITPNHKPIQINAKVVNLGSFSGHAGQDDLIFYQENLKLKKGAKFIYNHGDPLSIKGIMDRVANDNINPHVKHIKAELNKRVLIYESNTQKLDGDINLTFF